MSAIFPGSVSTHGFWRNILAKKDQLTEVPPSHWLIEDYYDPNPKTPDKTYGRRGAFLPDVPFDAMAFGIPPNQLEATDSGQLLSLIVARQVLEDAYRGQFTSANKERISVVLGTTGATELILEMANRMERPKWVKALREEGLDEAAVERVCDRIASHYVQWQESSFPGLLPNVVAGRIAHKLDLGGTNFITDAACASSFAALQAAMNELYLGQSDLVITGGVDALNTISMFMCFSKTPALSPTGDCRPFSEDADGTMLGEGIGMIAIKRLADAERDGDDIHAIIRGIGSSSDGKGSSVYAPVPEGQARALRKAYENAGCEPRTVELIEAHGTGTKAGDAAETQGLQSVFTVNGHGGQWCALGSVKSNIGHTKAAAGIAGLMKTVLALRHKTLPPTIKISAPNPKLKLDESAFYLNTEPRPWIRGASHPRRAGISSFGFGGTNFHVIVEEYRGPGKARPRLRLFPSELFLWSADSADALRTACREALTGCEDEGLARLADASRLAFHADAPLRLAIVASDAADLRRKLEQALDRLAGSAEPFTLPTGIYFGAGARRGALGFLFSGQGSQYVNMGAELAMSFDAARAAWDEVAESALWAGTTALHQVVFPPPAFSDAERAAREEQLRATEWAQPAIANASASMLRLLEAIGLRPDGCAGHSLGELTALHAAGVFDHAALIAIARRRGELMKAAAQTPGAMLAVKASAEAVEQRLREWGSGATVANYNAPEQIILAGTEAEIAEVRKRLEAESLNCTPLAVATAFHSHIVAPAVPPFQAFLNEVEIRPPALPVYANLDGERYADAPEAIRRQLGEQLEQPVRFVQQIEKMYADGIRVFLEVGPQAVLTGLVDATLAGREYAAIALDRKGQDGVTRLWHALGQLAAAGFAFDSAALLAGYETAEPPIAKPAGPLTVPVNGANYGKLYPPKGGAAALPKPNPVVVPPPAPAPVRQEPMPIAPPPPLAPAPVAPPSDWITAFQHAQQQTLEAHAQFQRTMAESHQAFLKAAELSMMGLTHLAGGLPAEPVRMPVPAAPPALAPAAPPRVEALPPSPSVAPAVVAAPPSPPPPTPAPAPAPAPALDLDAMMLRIVSEKTGYPAEMLNLEMELDNDLGIDSIKRVEIFATLMEQNPALQSLDTGELAKRATLGQIVEYVREQLGNAAPASVAAPAASAPSGLDFDLDATMLRIVSEKTGYPAEMLNLEMELDNDLGIDSIKRVEIFATLMEQNPALQSLDTSELAKRATLGQIVDYVREQLQGGPAPASALAAPVAVASAPAAAPVSVERFALEWVAAPATGWAPAALRPGARIVVTEDGGGIAAALAARLSAEGLAANVLSAEAAQGASDADGVIFLGGLAAEADFASAGRIQREAFQLARAHAARMAAQGGLFVTVQDTGGRFGAGGASARAWLGGLTGLAKTADLEWPRAAVKAIDLARGQRSPDALADALADELLRGGPEREIGLPLDGTRGTLVSVARAADAPAGGTLPRGAVLVVSGGARGVTAASLAALAEAVQPRLALLGRTPLAEEPAVCAGIADEAGLKRALLADAQGRGETCTPAQLSERVNRVLANREIRATLRAFEAAGAETRYVVADARDARSVSEALAAVRAAWGPIDGIIHGAGVIADKWIAEKKDEQFDLVFSTKVDGLHALLDATAQDPLQLICLFSSVAGRAGNAGQCDYAMGNEVLNKVASYEAARRGSTCRVKSINWGPWESGMVGPALKARFLELGVPLIPLSVGARMFVEEVLGASPSEVEVVIGGKPAGSLLADVSTLPARELRRKVSARNAGFLAGHRIKGEAVVPFTLVHEWFLRAVRAVRPDLAGIEIREMKALKGIVLQDFAGAGDSFTLRLATERATAREARFKLELLGAGGTLHYQAVAELRETAAPAQAAPPPTHLAAWPLSRIYDGDVLFHQDEFRVIESIAGVGDEGIAGVLGGASLSAETRRAVLLDGALQLAVLWHWRQAGGGSLPTAIGSVAMHGAINGGPLQCEVRGRLNGPQRAVADIVLRAASGEVVAELRGLELVVYLPKAFAEGVAQ